MKSTSKASLHRQRKHKYRSHTTLPASFLASGTISIVKALVNLVNTFDCKVKSHAEVSTTYAARDVLLSFALGFKLFVVQVYIDKNQ